MSCAAILKGMTPVDLPRDTAFGALIAYATSPETKDYQPMHVNFGIMRPLDEHIRNKQERYTRYAQRGADAMESYVKSLRDQGLLPEEG